MLDEKLVQIISRCEGAYSDKTLSGYTSDLRMFALWCKARDLPWLPADPEAVASFVDDEARIKSIATIKRRISAIKFAHRIADLPSPIERSVVHLALRRAG